MKQVLFEIGENKLLFVSTLMLIFGQILCDVLVCLIADWLVVILYALIIHFLTFALFIYFQNSIDDGNFDDEMMIKAYLLVIQPSIYIHYKN